MTRMVSAQTWRKKLWCLLPCGPCLAYMQVETSKQSPRDLNNWLQALREWWIVTGLHAPLTSSKILVVYPSGGQPIWQRIFKVSWAKRQHDLIPKPMNSTKGESSVVVSDLGHHGLLKKIWNAVLHSRSCILFIVKNSFLGVFLLVLSCFYATCNL